MFVCYQTCEDDILTSSSAIAEIARVTYLHRQILRFSTERRKTCARLADSQ